MDDKILAETVFQIMKDGVNRTRMTIVHEKLVILGEGDSPPGWTSILLIDESHVSSHAYTDRGWLALDCFTCSYTDPGPIMDFIVNEIKSKFPSLTCTYKKKHKRFHYR